MYPSTGLQNALNYMRQMSVAENRVYHQYIPVITDSTTIGEFAAPLLTASDTTALNDFFGLLQKVVATAIDSRKRYNNPLEMLEGDNMPLGQFVEDVYINPIRPIGFDVNDFAGLLQKYDAEIAVQYLGINSDLQYPVTITREKVRNAFTSWNNLETFINGIVNALYNGAYITRYEQTKGLILSAYKANNIMFENVSAVSDAATAKALVEKMRATFTKMKHASTRFNAWKKVKGLDAPVLKVWSDPEDIVVVISSDVEAKVDVEVLAAAFNMSKTDFLGRVIVLDDFNQYNEDGSVAVDGSGIQAGIFDKAWFKIRTQDFALDEFYNAKNRTWQYFLNDVRMCRYSVFANAVLFATSGSNPTIDATDVKLSKSSVSVKAGETETVLVGLVPANATSEVTVQSSAPTYATATISEGKVVITGKLAGSATITVTANSHTATISVTVTESASE